MAKRPSAAQRKAIQNNWNIYRIRGMITTLNNMRHISRPPWQATSGMKRAQDALEETLAELIKQSKKPKGVK